MLLLRTIFEAVFKTKRDNNSLLNNYKAS